MTAKMDRELSCVPDDLLLDAEALFSVPGLTKGWSFRAARLGPEWDALAGQLMPEELAPSSSRVAKRTREIIAGRILARVLMVEAGLKATPLPMGADRAPIWPAGYTGSITHTDGIVAVALGRRHLGTIGIDIEGFKQLDPAVGERIRRHDETGNAISLFVAKEAVFKAQYPQTGEMLSHHEVRILWTESAFDAEIKGVPYPARGFMRETSDWIAAVCIVADM